MKYLILLLCLISHPLMAQTSASVCLTCHRPEGFDSKTAWPNLAGQHPSYLIKQMQDIRAGRRVVPVMSALLQQLTDKEIEDLAAYYATMPNTSALAPITSVRGEQLYKNGDFKKRINACTVCHGPRGSGNDKAGFPALKGQPAAYIIMQLDAFKKGKRTNDLHQIMQNISQHMSDEEIEAVATYIQSLH